MHVHRQVPRSLASVLNRHRGREPKARIPAPLEEPIPLALIELTVHWIEMEELTEAVMKDMPEGK
jgi:hypothetical protein